MNFGGVSTPTVELQALCLRVVSGGTPSRSEPAYFQGGTIPWMKTGEVKKGFVYGTEEHITDLGLENSSAKLIPANSLVVAMYGDGDTAGNLAHFSLFRFWYDSRLRLSFRQNILWHRGFLVLCSNW